MTFEEALKKVREMTDEERDNLKTIAATAPGSPDNNYIDFIVLDLDPETEAPTDEILHLMTPEDALPEIYNIGVKVPFIINEKKALCQILDVCRFQPIDILEGLTDKQKALAIEVTECGWILMQEFPNDFSHTFTSHLTYLVFLDIRSGDPDRIARAEKFIAECKSKEKAGVKRYIEEYKKEADE